ncbi:DDE-type integrase/transposase/recombinase [Escherichia coli]|uniref:DDE-type integrase/transposase/recombinase n=1 Tax=Escherichia coli TaxID=562 RepID=UPI003457BA35
MNPFKGRHFQRDIILWAVRWYCKYGISYRELQEMLAERGVNVDHSTIYRWVQRYAPEMEKRQREGRCPSDVEHRQIKYRNNVIECDHGKLKRIIGATLGFKSMKTAYATIKGIEVMRALRKGQASAFYYGDPLGEMRLVSRVFEM